MSETNPTVPYSLVSFKRNGLVLLIDPERPAWAMVNRLGAEIADLCDGTRSADDIVRAVAAKYAMSPDEVSGDVSAFLRMLENAGLVFNGEPETVRRLNMGDYVGPISSVAIELTERCNLRCIHCFEDAGMPNKPDPSTTDVLQWIDKFAHIPDVAINLTGGEILLRSDWQQLLGHLAQRDMVGVILTNGTLINDAVAAEIARISNGARFTFQVSLDGPDPETNDRIRGEGSFEASIDGIKALSSYGLANRMVISFTPSKMNVNRIDDMLDLVLDLGLPKFHISLLNRMGRADEIWSTLGASTSEMIEFYDRLHARGQELEDRLFISGDFCSMLHQKIQRIPVPPMVGCRLGVDLKIDTSGDVYPCTPLAFDKKYSLGNIRDMSAEDIQNSPNLRQLREQFIPRIEGSECRSCAWKCFCAGGCIARAELNYGTIFHPDDLCGLANELYLRTFFRQADRQRSKAVAEAR